MVARRVALTTLAACLLFQSHAFAQAKPDTKKKPTPPTATAPAQPPAAAPPRTAPNADGTPIAVLLFDEEGFEDQAEAITLALRSRLRTAGGWSLREDVPSIALISAANRCGEIDAACQVKIADALRLDYFIWGRVDRHEKGQVTATMHLYRRSGGSATVATETYSENLRDQNDDTLRRIAQRSIDKLLGRTVGKLLVTAPATVGTVVVDGKRYALDGGKVTLELPAGPHHVDVMVRGFATQSRDLTVPASEQITFDVPAVRDEAATGEEPKKMAVPPRTLLSVGLIVVGAAAAVGSTYFAIDYASENSKAKDLRTAIPPEDDVCDEKWSKFPQLKGAREAREACGHAQSANRSAPWAWVLGGLAVAGIGAGVYLLVTTPAEPKTTARSIRVVPNFSNEPGLSVVGRF